MALPKFIYVHEVSEAGGKYFVASNDPGEQEEGVVGVYDLREILDVRHSLEFRRKGTKIWFKSSMEAK